MASTIDLCCCTCTFSLPTPPRTHHKCLLLEIWKVYTCIADVHVHRDLLQYEHTDIHVHVCVSVQLLQHEHTYVSAMTHASTIVLCCCTDTFFYYRLHHTPPQMHIVRDLEGTYMYCRCTCTQTVTHTDIHAYVHGIYYVYSTLAKDSTERRERKPRKHSPPPQTNQPTHIHTCTCTYTFHVVVNHTTLSPSSMARLDGPFSSLAMTFLCYLDIHKIHVYAYTCITNL